MDLHGRLDLLFVVANADVMPVIDRVGVEVVLGVDVVGVAHAESKSTAVLRTGRGSAPVGRVPSAAWTIPGS